MKEPLKRLRRRVKRIKFWEGVAAILASFGIIINPESMAEIISGLFLIWGGIEMWGDDKEEGLIPPQSGSSGSSGETDNSAKDPILK